MAKFRSIKNSFLAGEISAAAQARTDLPQYPHACKLLRNMIPVISGGAYRRPGSFFEKRLAGIDEYAPRLIPFARSKAEAYCLYLGNVYTGAGKYVGGFRVTSNLARSTAIVCTGSHQYNVANGAVAGVGFYDEIHDVQYVQSADVLYMTHPRYMPHRIRRTAQDTFDVGIMQNYFVDGSIAGAGTAPDTATMFPFLPENTTPTTITASGTVAGAAIGLSATAAIFNPLHVGSQWAIIVAGVVGVVRVTAYVDAQHVNATVLKTIGGLGATASWRESAWSDYRGWPTSIGFYERRLVYGGTVSQPDTLWFSQEDNYDVVSILDTAIPDPRDGPTGIQPFTVTLASQQLNRIQWISPDKTLMVGTTGDEWVISREDPSKGFRCDNFVAVTQSHFGSSAIQPVREGNETIFCRASQDTVLSLSFNVLQNAYLDEQVQAFFDEYPKQEPVGSQGNRKYRTMAWDGSRQTLWACDTAGNLFGLTRNRQQQFTSWHSHQMGGYDATKTGGKVDLGGGHVTFDPAYYAPAGSVVSLAVVPNPVSGTDDIWLVVKRFINGAYSWCIERIIGGACPADSAYTAIVTGLGTYMVDCASYFNTITGDTVYNPGADYEGEALSGTAFNSNGMFHITGTAVAAGNTTLNKPYPTGLTANLLTNIIFGLDFTSIVVPVRPDAGSQIGTAQGAIKRIHDVEVRFFRTMSAKVGASLTQAETLIFRDGTTPMGESPELYTGDKRVQPQLDYDRDDYLFVFQDCPLPFYVAGIVQEGLTYD